MTSPNALRMVFIYRPLPEPPRIPPRTVAALVGEPEWVKATCTRCIGPRSLRRGSQANVERLRRGGRFACHSSSTGLVRGGVRDVVRPTSRRLDAERWHDLPPEDLDLLEDGRERQARVVHEEQLALVVAHVLAHGGVSLDHLLG